MFIVSNLTTNRRLSNEVRFARTPWLRTVGFLDRKTIREDEAIWFDRCSQIHTLGMRAPIDVIFLDEHHRVLGVERRVRANRCRIAHRGARSVLEFGASANTKIRVGDRLAFVPR